MKARTIGLVQLFSLLVGLVLPSLTAAQSDNTQWRRQVQQQLDYATLALNWSYQLEPSHELYTTRLNNNTYVDVRYNLDAGVNYVFLGVCDNDCSGLQLRLYDGYGQLVDVDASRGGYPVVATSVGRSGIFYLRLTMRQCRANPCWAGVGVYR